MTVLVAMVLAGLGGSMVPRLVRTFVTEQSTSRFASSMSASIAASGGALIAPRMDGPLALIAHCMLVVALVALCEIDVRERRLPREISYSAALVGGALLVASRVIGDESGRVLGVVVGAGLFTGLMLVLLIASRGALGDGDVRLAPLLGAFLGYSSPTLVPFALLVASSLGCIVGAILAVIRKSGRATTLPFGPCLALGTMVALATAQ